ncbi:MAG: hypothetical protein KAI17_23320, partial [Thiotrichaceae bacterium]|nr:hypothetical protein [Thiotrichaceae bacterium]
GVAQSGVLVKKSKIGLFGAKLYEEKNMHKAVKNAMALSQLYPNDLTPSGMINPVLKAVVNAILHCETLTEVTQIINDAENIAATVEQKQTDPASCPPAPASRGVMFIATRINEKNQFAPIQDMQAASVMVLTHIISAIYIKSGLVSSGESIEEVDAVMLATFMSLVGNQLFSILRYEETNISIVELVASTGNAAFSLLSPELKTKALTEGVEQAGKILAASDEAENVKKYTDSVSKLVYAYVRSDDEQYLDGLYKMYVSLVDANE